MLPPFMVLLALLLLLPTAASAGGRVVVTPAADHLTLGIDSQVKVSFQTEASVATIGLRASVGTFEAPSRVAPGRFEAIYLAPKGRLPRVAILAAFTAEGDAGWAALPLWGQGDATVHSRPRVSVAVTIQGRVFGPAVSDDLGVAQIPIVVPPGERAAYDGTKPIDLQLPETAHLLAVAPREQLAADREEVLPLHVYVVDARGAPRTDAVLEHDGAADGCIFSETKEPGVYQGRWRLKSGGTQPSELSVWLADEPSFLSKVSVQRPAGPPARATLDPLPKGVVAGEEKFTLSGTVMDGAGNPASGAPRVFAGGARPERLETPEPGRFVATFSAPPRVGPEGALTALVESPSRTLLAQGSIPHLAGAPAWLGVEQPEGSVLGGEEVTLSFFVVDRFGNPVRSTGPLQISPGRLRVLAVQIGTGQERSKVTVSPPPVRFRESFVLEASASELAAQARVEVRPADERLALGPVLGFVHDGAAFGSPRLGAIGLGRVRAVHEGLLAGGEISFYRRAQSFEAAGGGTATLSLLPISVLLGWTHALSERLAVIAAIGGGPAYLSSRATLGGQGAQTESGLGLGVRLSCALSYRMPVGAPFVELRLERLGSFPLRSVDGSLLLGGASVGWLFDPL